MHKVGHVAWSQSHIEIQCGEWCWIQAGDALVGRLARRHGMNAEWDEEHSVQQWKSNAKLWWSKWAEEMEAMSDTLY